MRSADRLSPLDSSFLALEGESTSMNLGGCVVLDGPPPSSDELLTLIGSRLHLVPRYRQRLAFVPLGLGRPVWVDDPRFTAAYHVRRTALPRPGGDAELSRLAGRLFSQALDRERPLWEIWLVEGVAEGRFALIFKTHHALVDGISGVDIASVLFDASADPPSAREDGDWTPRPLPGGGQLLADALRTRAAAPGEVVRGAAGLLRGPREVSLRLRRALGGVGALASAGFPVAPASPFNVRIGAHRRFAWVTIELDRFKRIKNAAGATVNDVVLAVVAGALGRHLRRHGHPTDGVVLKAMAPVSIRGEIDRGVLGNQLTAIWAPLPVGIEDPVLRLDTVRAAMTAVKESGQAIGGQVLTQLSGFAPPRMLSRAARLQVHQRLFNLAVTNVPGPQQPRYLLGRRMRGLYPMVPLTENTALAVAVISYDGQISFGLIADYDALPDVERLAGDLRAEIAATAAALLPAGDNDRRAARAPRGRVVRAAE